MDNLSNFLTGLTTEESLFFLAFILGGFLLGILLGVLLRSAAIRRQKKELEKKNEELIDLQGQHNALTQKYSQLENELNTLKQERVEHLGKLEVMEEENSKLHKTVFQLNNEYDKLKSSSQSYESTIEDLNDQIIGLKAKIEKLNAQLEEGGRPEKAPEPEKEEEPAKDDSFTAEAPMVVNLSDEEDARQEKRLDALEQKLEHLMGENNLLRREIEALKEEQPNRPATFPKNNNGGEDVDDEFAPQDGADLNLGTSNIPETSATGPFSPQDRSLFAAPSGVAEQAKDNLTLIEGIGPFIEQKLNDIGIFTYEQISQFDDARIEEVTQKIQFFEGRIKKDDWVGQAHSLHQIKLQNPAAFNVMIDEEGAELLPEAPEPQEDLKIIEGIGPKIESLLKENNIKTVNDIASASATHLQEILEKGGDSFRLHDATTWPAQARLAVNGDWELLKEYQERLRGGREVEEEEK